MQSVDDGRYTFVSSSVVCRGTGRGGGGWGEEQGKVDVSPGLVKKYFLTLVYLLSIIMLFIILHPRPKLYGFTTVW